MSEASLVDLQATLYNSKNPTRRWLHTLRKNKIENYLQSVASSGVLRALEVGPGSGVYLPSLCQIAKEAVALDVESAHLENLEPLKEKHANLKLKQGDIVSGINEDQFQLVLCSEVIEHVPHPEEFMKGLASVTAPGGWLVLSTPQPLSTIEVIGKIALSRPLIGLTRLIYNEPVLPTGHISLLSRRKVRQLLGQNGFEILNAETFGLYLPLVAEFMPQTGLFIEQKIEQLLRSAGVQFPLWTQLYLARKTEH